MQDTTNIKGLCCDSQGEILPRMFFLGSTLSMAPWRVVLAGQWSQQCPVEVQASITFPPVSHLIIMCSCAMACRQLEPWFGHAYKYPKIQKWVMKMKTHINPRSTQFSTMQHGYWASVISPTALQWQLISVKHGFQMEQFGKYCPTQLAQPRGRLCAVSSE